MTNVNAYFAEVEAAKVKVAQAEGELQAAQEALETHPDYVAPKPVRESKVEPETKAKDGSGKKASEAPA